MPVAPDPDPLSAPYWEGARRHELLLQVCRACGATWHPPEPACPACQSGDVAWQPASGRGVVYAYTVVHHATHPAFADEVPYNVALIDLEEGPRVIANVRCPDADLRCDMPVRAIFEDHDGYTLPQFRPAAEEPG